MTLLEVVGVEPAGQVAGGECSGGCADVVFAASDGWGPLCDFLGVDAPFDEPYPHLNDAETLRRMFTTMAESNELNSPFEPGNGKTS